MPLNKTIKSLQVSLEVNIFMQIYSIDYNYLKLVQRCSPSMYFPLHTRFRAFSVQEGHCFNPLVLNFHFCNDSTCMYLEMEATLTIFINMAQSCISLHPIPWSSDWKASHRIIMAVIVTDQY
jgi:hypothetical protein